MHSPMYDDKMRIMSGRGKREIPGSKACDCGRTISGTAKSCLSCSQAKEATHGLAAA